MSSLCGFRAWGPGVRSAGLLLLILPLVATTATTVSAQSWRVIDAVGYGGLGFGLGVAATWDLEGEGFGPPDAALVAVGAGTVAGLTVGAMLGGRADRAIADGRAVGGPHRAAVLGGGVLAGGTLGALAAVPFINSEGEGTFLGSDETTFGVFVVTGAALGSLYTWRRSDQLSSGHASVTPVLGPGGERGIRLRIGF